MDEFEQVTPFRSGITVELLESDFNHALIGVVAGDTHHFAVYDQEKIIKALVNKGYSHEESAFIFDTCYFPKSASPGGPSFLIEHYSESVGPTPG